MKENLRICVVAPLYHPSFGGIGRQAQLLTERLARSGIKMFVIARRMKGMTPAEFDPDIRVFRAWSIKPYVYTFEKVNLSNLIISLSFAVSCAVLLTRKRNEYDIVHFHGASLPLFFNILLLKLLGKRVLAKVASAKLGIEAGSLSGRYLGIGNLILKLLRPVDGFVAITDEIEEGLLKDGFSGGRIKKIPNFIDFDHFGRATDILRSQKKEQLGFLDLTVVTFSGRFIPRKGISYLLRAWKKVSIEIPGSKLILLGDGPLLPEMKKLAADLGISQRVDFRGHVDDVKNFLLATDVFVLPSLQEGMPNSLLEAMACGLAPVATRIGGVVDIVTNGKSGIIADPGNVDDLAKSLLIVLRDGDLRKEIAISAYETVRDNYHLEKIMMKYIELYSEMSNQDIYDRSA